MSAKKGALSIEIMIIAVLGIIVLVILAALFSSQVKNFVSQIFGITEQAGDVSRNCRLQGYYCTSDESSCSKRGGFIVPEPPEGWTDCKAVCCQVAK